MRLEIVSQTWRQNWGDFPVWKKFRQRSNIPGRSFNQNEIFESTHPENDIDASELVVDHDFLKVLNISLAEGRDFLRENPADADNAFLINETTARNLQLDHPVGKQITWERDGNAFAGYCDRCCENFNFPIAAPHRKTFVDQIRNWRFQLHPS